jgi:hypothetical protein
LTATFSRSLAPALGTAIAVLMQKSESPGKLGGAS